VERVSNTQVISPINGKINKLLFNTLGAIVSEGEALAEIVPTDNELEIKGFIDPKDIGLVEPGQVARISLTAFDPSKYGFLTGVLKDISVDAIFREETRSYMYEITTTVNSDSLTNELGQQIDILPGMIAQINIIRGQRSVLDYLWQPISKTKDYAFRE
jgi:adhesin transport system membrane fusion protein